MTEQLDRVRHDTKTFEIYSHADKQQISQLSTTYRETHKKENPGFQVIYQNEDSGSIQTNTKIWM